MATLHICTVGVGGGYDYGSLSLAEAANFGAGGSNLVALDKYVVVECYPGTGPDTTACTISGFTTDATHNITIRAHASARHAGKWTTSAYILRVTGTATAITATSQSNVTFDGLQIDFALPTQQYRYGITAGSNPVRNCIVRGLGASTPANSGGISGTGPIECCVVYGFGTGSGTVGISSGPQRNNTVYACATGIRAHGTTAHNCVSSSCSTACFSGVPSASSNNYSTDATSYQTANRNVTVIFADAAGEDFHIAPDNAFAGVDLSAYFTTDIDGQTITIWSAGADAQAGADAGGQYLTISASWASLVGANRDTTWSLLTGSQKDASWADLNDSTRLSAWVDLNDSPKEVSWADLSNSFRVSSWADKTQSQKQSDWGVLAAASPDSSWAILKGDFASSAWDVLSAAGLFSRNVSWTIITEHGAPSSWALAAQNDQIASWRVVGKSTQTSEWSVVKIDNSDLSWAITEQAAGNSSWMLLTVDELLSSWRIGESPPVSVPLSRLLSIVSESRLSGVTSESRLVAINNESRTIIIL